MSKTSLRAQVIATLRPTSWSTDNNVVALSHTVPSDHACSFDFVKASDGSNHAPTSGATPLDGLGRDSLGDREVGVKVQMRPVLFDRSNGQPVDALCVEAFIQLGGPKCEKLA